MGGDRVLSALPSSTHAFTQQLKQAAPLAGSRKLLGGCVGNSIAWTAMGASARLPQELLPSCKVARPLSGCATHQVCRPPAVRGSWFRDATHRTPPALLLTATVTASLQEDTELPPRSGAAASPSSWNALCWKHREEVTKSLGSWTTTNEWDYLAHMVQADMLLSYHTSHSLLASEASFRFICKQNCRKSHSP